jgi:hypothetical protein
MAGISQAQRQLMVDHLLGTTTWTAPSAIYVGLHTGANSATGAGQEVTTTATGYARTSHAAWHSATAANPAIAYNNGTITFPTATANWGDILSISLYDTATGGTYLGYASITTKTITTNDVARFASSQLSVRLDETA